jgi:hypothetical protein
MARNQELIFVGYVNFLVIRWVKIKYFNKTTEFYLLTMPHWDLEQSINKGSVMYKKESNE